MPYRIGGYFMSFSTARKVMEALSIPNPYNYKNEMPEFAINLWLCDKEKTDVLAAYLRWDNKPGMMFVSSFIYIAYRMPDSGDLQESEKDLTITKEWLVKEEANSSGSR
ncbi:hypothetical protein EV421DRAFT_1743518 [Armillaria borealis]|uniref:Uncharacterized protein n=1 Tax=Armillaria borealis TaxID=47425 RepID=A0AA39IY61_9AGAR|nr:hypothetical protein EV421DRAFT_1743518 [Armillaria borealis]